MQEEFFNRPILKTFQENLDSHAWKSYISTIFISCQDQFTVRFSGVNLNFLKFS
jgi:hypothetical protein